MLADTGLHREATERRIKDLRRQLITENVANIRAQRVRSVMVPWSPVRWLPASATGDAVLAQVSHQRFSRWLVVEPRTGVVAGYLLTKDLVARAADANWAALLRPLRAIAPDEFIESVLGRMRIGLRVHRRRSRAPRRSHHTRRYPRTGRRTDKDEYPHETTDVLIEALARGALVCHIDAVGRTEALETLVQAIPTHRLPDDMDKDQLLRSMSLLSASCTSASSKADRDSIRAMANIKWGGRCVWAEVS